MPTLNRPHLIGSKIGSCLGPGTTWTSLYAWEMSDYEQELIIFPFNGGTDASALVSVTPVECRSIFV
jgi:hypothetical protein